MSYLETIHIKAWLVEATRPVPHEFVLLDKEKAQQYAVKYVGVVVPLVVLPERRK